MNWETRNVEKVLPKLRNTSTFFFKSLFVCLISCRSLFTTFQQEDGAGVTHRRSTSHSVRRFTGTAMLMTNRLPEECLAETAKTFAEPIAESTEPSHTSLRSRKSLHTDN